MRGRARRRMESVAGYLHAIIPSFSARIGVDSSGSLILQMIQSDDGFMALVAWFDGPAVMTRVMFSDGHGIGTPEAVATKIHTDDEIARKLAVRLCEMYGLHGQGAAEAGDADSASLAFAIRDKLLGQIDEWGRGTGRRFQP
jgi:hypothetical protein